MTADNQRRIEYIPSTATLDCPVCSAVVAASIEGSYAYFQEGPDVPTRYLLAKCPRCKSPMVAIQENWGDWHNDHHFEKPSRVLPETSRLGRGVPMSIKTAFEEASRCYGAQAYAATTIMCRKALEALIVAHEIEAPNLAAGLEDLRGRGLVEARLFEWADALRLAGNDAAHDVLATVPQEDARDTLDFTAALIEYVFTFRDRFEEFKARREDRPVNS